MKFLDYLYYNLYNWYYRDGKNSKSSNPTLMAAMSFGLCVGGWCVFTSIVYFEVSTTSIDPVKDRLILAVSGLTLLVGALINEIYLSKNRYLNLYLDYSSRIKNKKKGFLLSWLFILLPYLLLLGYMLYNLSK